MFTATGWSKQINDMPPIPFAWEKVLFRLHLLQRLVKKGFTPNQAIVELDQMSDEAIYEEMALITKGPDRMITFNATVTQAIEELPHLTTSGWLRGIHKLYAAMGASAPDWQEGCHSVPNQGDIGSSEAQWALNLAHLLDRGMELKVSNARAYWFIRRATSTWANIGTHRIIELCYVSPYGDELHGHATEYFPEWQCETAFCALRERIKNNGTTNGSTLGMSLETAILLNSI